MRPDPLLQYRRTYGQQSPGIGLTDFLLHLLEQTCSLLYHFLQANMFARPCALPHTFLYPGLNYCGICQFTDHPCPSKAF